MTTISRPVTVAVVGATGLAGQQFLAALQTHPTFQIAALAASARSAGKTYRDALCGEHGELKWYPSGALPPSLGDLLVQDAEHFDAASVELVFSAMESGPAKSLEPRYARTTPVVSTASAFRYEEDVPLLLPGINLEQAVLIRTQQRQRGWKGFLRIFYYALPAGTYIAWECRQNGDWIRSGEYAGAGDGGG